MTDDTTPLTPDEDATPAGDEGPATPGAEQTGAGGADASATSAEQGGGVATQAPPAPRPRTPPFVRSSTDRVVGGVAGAVAARLDVDPTLVRVVFVVLGIISGGVAVPAYLLAWAVIARDDDPSPRVYDYVAIRDGGVFMWVIAVVLAVALVDGILDPFDAFNGAPLFPLLLIGIGVALWTRGGRDGASSPSWPRREPGGPPAASAAAPPPPGTGWAGTTEPSTTDPMSTTGSTTVPLDTPTHPTTPAPPTQQDGGWPPAGTRPVATPPPPGRPRPPRERSILGSVTIALALIAAGVAAALNATTTVDLGATGVASIALLTIGLGLLVGSVWGRARWLLLVGLLMMPFIGLGVVVREAGDTLGIDVDLSSGVGERRIDLAGDDRLPDQVELLAGSIDLDLASWQPTGSQAADLDGEGYDLEIQLGAGEVDIEMPADVAWRVTSELGLGEYRVRGDDVRITDTVEETFPLSDGEELGREFVREGGPEDGPVLDVLVDVGVGQITIRETTPTAATGDDTEELS